MKTWPMLIAAAFLLCGCKEPSVGTEALWRKPRRKWFPKQSKRLGSRKSNCPLHVDQLLPAKGTLIGVFHSANGAGSLKDCGCNLKPLGGLARRAEWLKTHDGRWGKRFSWMQVTCLPMAMPRTAEGRPRMVKAREVSWWMPTIKWGTQP